MSDLDYLLIGHVTADLTRNGRLLGGTVSYGAPIAHLFGYKVGLLTSAMPGEKLIASLQPHAQMMVKASPVTTTFENIYDDTGHRSQYVHGTALNLEYSDIPTGWVDTPLIHLAPLVNEIDPGIIYDLPKSTIMMTPQGWLRQWQNDGKVHFKPWFDPEILSHVDLVVFSRQDVAAQPDLADQYVKVCKRVVITDGRNGGVMVEQGKQTPYTAYPAEEIDPTGAGDVFATSLLASLPRVDFDWSRALDVAARLAAISVTRAGMQALSADEVEQAIIQSKKP